MTGNSPLGWPFLLTQEGRVGGQRSKQGQCRVRAGPGRRAVHPLGASRLRLGPPKVEEDKDRLTVSP